MKIAGKDVWVFPIGGFGQVLHAIGASNFGSGIFGKETSSVAMFDKDSGGFQREDRWIYHPDLFVYVNAKALEETGYTCACNACNGGIASTLALKKQHDALVRVNSAKALVAVPEEDRLAYMKQRIQDAIAIVRNSSNKKFVPKSAFYLEKWLGVVETALTWPASVEEDDNLLNELLGEIDGDV